jgi:crotonobetainyl-CoA:carnitine CoA-transferase CaiB-like acyl-CoA transferase
MARHCSRWASWRRSFASSVPGKAAASDASLMGAALDLQAESLVAWANAPAKPRVTQAFRNVAGWYYAAPYGVYATSDGHMALSLVPLKVLAEVLDEPRLAAFSDQDSWSRQDEITG